MDGWEKDREMERRRGREQGESGRWKERAGRGGEGGDYNVIILQVRNQCAGA